MSDLQMADGQRVEVRLIGEDRWHAGTVLRPLKGEIKLDTPDLLGGYADDRIDENGWRFEWRPLVEKT